MSLLTRKYDQRLGLGLCDTTLDKSSQLKISLECSARQINIVDIEVVHNFRIGI